VVVGVGMQLLGKLTGHPEPRAQRSCVDGLAVPGQMLGGNLAGKPEQCLRHSRGRARTIGHRRSHLDRGRTNRPAALRSR
jgi:hypothetical protein